MRRIDTIQCMGLWKQLNNPNFNRVEFDTFRNEAGHGQLKIKDAYGNDAFEISDTFQSRCFTKSRGILCWFE